jgi:hypothetical protein
MCQLESLSRREFPNFSEFSGKSTHNFTLKGTGEHHLRCQTAELGGEFSVSSSPLPKFPLSGKSAGNLIDNA